MSTMDSKHFTLAEGQRAMRKIDFLVLPVVILAFLMLQFVRARF